jgi:phosphorylcholine metabolism protein LicD
MKKILQILLLSIGLIGCSSLELEPISSSADETQRILSLGLTHEENLIEAGKLNSFHMISVVIGQLNKAKDEKIQAEVNLVESAKFAEMVVVSDNYTNFTGSKVSESIKQGVLLTDVDIHEYYLSGVKGTNYGLLNHQLQLTIKHNSSDKRVYSSANLCEKWNSCDVEQRDVVLISSIASNCTTTGCDYTEVMELDLAGYFLTEKMEDGFTLRFNSKKETNKITISSAYIKGYLKIAK